MNPPKAETSWLDGWDKPMLLAIAIFAATLLIPLVGWLIE